MVHAWSGVFSAKKMYMSGHWKQAEVRVFTQGQESTPENAKAIKSNA